MRAMIIIVAAASTFIAEQAHAATRLDVTVDNSGSGSLLIVDCSSILGGGTLDYYMYINDELKRTITGGLACFGGGQFYTAGGLQDEIEAYASTTPAIMRWEFDVGDGYFFELFFPTFTSYSELSQSSILSDQILSSTVGTTTISLTDNLLGFLNVPQLFQTKFPFAYFFEVKDALLNISTSSAATLPSGTINWDIPTGQGTTTVALDFFSTTTVSQFLPSAAIAPLRAIMVAILYVNVGLFLYHDARSKKHLS